MLNFSLNYVTIGVKEGNFNTAALLPPVLTAAGRIRRVYEKSFTGFVFMPY